jgi:GNAT superfamily N-acetyltransferase
MGIFTGLADMEIQIKCVVPYKVDYHVVKTRLSKLHLEYGLMFGTFKKLREAKCTKSRCFLATVDGKVVGWSLLIYRPKYYMAHNIYFYVQKNKRRNGIGTALLNRSVNYCKRKKMNYLVSGHDRGSVCFFTKTNIPRGNIVVY